MAKSIATLNARANQRFLGYSVNIGPCGHDTESDEKVCDECDIVRLRNPLQLDDHDLDAFEALDQPSKDASRSDYLAFLKDQFRILIGDREQAERLFALLGSRLDLYLSMTADFAEDQKLGEAPASQD